MRDEKAEALFSEQSELAEEALKIMIPIFESGTLTQEQQVQMARYFAKQASLSAKVMILGLK